MEDAPRDTGLTRQFDHLNFLRHFLPRQDTKQIKVDARANDMSFNRPLPSHLRSGSLSHATSTSSSASTGQSSALQARINEKKQELASLRELQALSAGLADQMEQLEQKLGTLSDGTEGEITPQTVFLTGKGD